MYAEIRSVLAIHSNGFVFSRVYTPPYVGLISALSQPIPFLRVDPPLILFIGLLFVKL